MIDVSGRQRQDDEIANLVESTDERAERHMTEMESATAIAQWPKLSATELPGRSCSVMQRFLSQELVKRLLYFGPVSVSFGRPD